MVHVAAATVLPEWGSYSRASNTRTPFHPPSPFPLQIHRSFPLTLNWDSHPVIPPTPPPFSSKTHAEKHDYPPCLLPYLARRKPCRETPHRIQGDHFSIKENAMSSRHTRFLRTVGEWHNGNMCVWDRHAHLDCPRPSGAHTDKFPTLAVCVKSRATI